tara:strand:+ start:1431 stop:1832 length:402 start_codon:yes stop_codon:yes gene_type:complete
MGYTNYWHQEKDFTTDEWDLIFSEFLYLLETMPDIIIDDSPIVNKGVSPEIIFNGNPKDGGDHETFILSRYARKKPDYEGQDITFNFCKTAEKPYDVAVWHLLYFAYNESNAITQIKRDRVSLSSIRKVVNYE